MGECCHIVHMPTPREGDDKNWLITGILVPVDKKPKQVFKIPVLVNKKPDWKSKIPVPVNKNIN